MTNPLDAHQNNFRARRPGQLRPVEMALFFGLAFVARNHRKAGAKIAMRERDTGIIRRGHDRRNAGHDFKRNFRRGEFLGFLAATAENVRVAALEPHDGVAFLGFGHQQLVQFALRNGMVF